MEFWPPLQDPSFSILNSELRKLGKAHTFDESLIK